MKVIRLAVVFLLFSAESTFAASFGGVEELYLGPSIQYFQWKENWGGREVVKESGPLFGFGAGIDVNLLQTEASGALKLKGKLEMFGGDVDYDGEITSSNPAFDGIPVNSDVVYFGMRQEMDLGWRLPLKAVAIEPFAGIGYQWWMRDISDAATLARNGVPLAVNGYTEWWDTAYCRLGARGRYDVSDQLRFFAEAGAKYPFYTENSADYPFYGTVTVKPEGDWSAFAEAGFRYKRFRTSFFYEGLRYSRSAGVPISPTTVLLQPASESDIFGISFSWAIR